MIIDVLEANRSSEYSRVSRTMRILRGRTPLGEFNMVLNTVSLAHERVSAVLNHPHIAFHMFLRLSAKWFY